MTDANEILEKLALFAGSEPTIPKVDELLFHLSLRVGTPEINSIIDKLLDIREGLTALAAAQFEM